MSTIDLLRAAREFVANEAAKSPTEQNRVARAMKARALLRKIDAELQCPEQTPSDEQAEIAAHRAEMEAEAASR